MSEVSVMNMSLSDLLNQITSEKGSGWMVWALFTASTKLALRTLEDKEQKALLSSTVSRNLEMFIRAYVKPESYSDAVKAMTDDSDEILKFFHFSASAEEHKKLMEEEMQKVLLQAEGPTTLQ